MSQHTLLTTELVNESLVVEDKAVTIQKLTGAKLSILYVVEPLPSIYVVGKTALVNHY